MFRDRSLFANEVRPEMLRARRSEVLIRPIPREEVILGGVIVPNQAQEKMQRGFILSSGPDCHELVGGEEVVFEWYGGQHLPVAGETLYKLEEELVIAVIERPEGTNARIWMGLPAVTRDRDRLILS